MRRPQPQFDPPVPGRRDLSQRSDLHAELFCALTHERGGDGFTRLHLAARKLPATGELGGRGAPRRQHPPGTD